MGMWGLGGLVIQQFRVLGGGWGYNPGQEAMAWALGPLGFGGSEP